MSNLSLYINPNGGSGSSQELITVESKIGGATTVVPAGATTVTGLINGSTVLTSPEFVDAQVEIHIGNIRIPGVDKGTGGIYYTKVLGSNTVTLSEALATDDEVSITIYGPIGTSGGGGGTGIETIVPGDNIAVDDTDPLNPEVSFTGILPIANGGTNASVAGITAINNIS